MRHRKLLAALSVGALTVVGGMAADPGNGNGGPPEDAGPPHGMPEEAENGCNGIERAQEETEGTPAEDVLEAVEDLLTNGDGCDS
jgi:hypothetical protein